MESTFKDRLPVPLSPSVRVFLNILQDNQNAVGAETITPNPHTFVESVGDLSSNKKAEEVTETTYAFASLFPPVREIEEDEEGFEYQDPLDAEVQKFVDFFAAIDLINEVGNEQAQKSRGFKKRRINKALDEVERDAKRVAEGLFVSIVEEISPKVSEVDVLGQKLNKFEEYLEDAEDDEESIRSLQSGSFTNPLMNIPTNVEMAESQDVLENTEQNVDEIKAQLLLAMEPTLKSLNLYEPLNKWVDHFRKDEK